MSPIAIGFYCDFEETADSAKTQNIFTTFLIGTEHMPP
jgi:hypothetical protein